MLKSILWNLSSSVDKQSNQRDETAQVESTVTSILAAAGSVFPVILRDKLSFHKELGSGTSFHVECHRWRQPEPDPALFVAVKHLRLENRNPYELKELYANVVRELSTLSHPPLKTHRSIISALAYGWTDIRDANYSPRPYLVVEYGTLMDFCLGTLKPASTPAEWDVLREFSLDIALGLGALHRSKIIHGDVKAANVLIFASEITGRDQVAKLADFGSVIFEEYSRGAESYRGTPIYLAPEHQPWSTQKNQESFPTKLLYKADIFSYGLLLWEIMLQRSCYIKGDWLRRGESEQQFLERIYNDGAEDGLLRLVEPLYEGMLQRQSGADLRYSVSEIFRGTLKDDPRSRVTMEDITDQLVVDERERGVVWNHPPTIWTTDSALSALKSDSLPEAPSRYTTKGFSDGKVMTPLVVRTSFVPHAGIGAPVTSLPIQDSEDIAKPAEVQEGMSLQKGVGLFMIPPKIGGQSTFVPGLLDLFNHSRFTNKPSGRT